MHRRILLIFFLMVSLTASWAVSAPAKKTPGVAVKMSGVEPIRMTPPSAPVNFRLADTCIVNNGGPICYYIYPWIIGDELYKAYQNPSLSCSNPYPFTVTDVLLPLYVLSEATFQISVDVERVDASVPSCPLPGEMLAMSPLYEITVEPDLYLITIPLDTPVTVTGPYFVGVYFSSAGNPYDAAVLTDSIPVSCVGYNDWGDGYVDLNDMYNDETGEKIFPGRLLIYSDGTVGGGGGTEPAPAARLIVPSSGQLLGATVNLWADDAAGSKIIKQAQFHYQSGLNWISLGVDADDDAPLRNGVAACNSGNGLSVRWNTNGLSEANYTIRAIITDTLGRADTASTAAHVDPTPPSPVFQQPTLGQNVCGGVTARVQCTDEDISYISFDYRKVARPTILPVPIVSQFTGGDTDGNSADGNRVADGEYGDYCSGPAAAASAVKYWYSKGYGNIQKESNVLLTDAQLMARLAAAMTVQENNGTYDAKFVGGLREYIASHGGGFAVYADHAPSAQLLLSWAFDDDYLVMAGISGNPCLWMTVAGLAGPKDDSGRYTIRFLDPTTATAIECLVKDDAGKLKIRYNSQWAEIDILAGMIPTDWTVTRSPVAFDVYGGDGWSASWNTTSLPDDSLYFLTATVNDAGGHVGLASVLVLNDCTPDYIAGDVNNDHLVSIGDLVYLAAFLFANGPQPPLGLTPADVNCDHAVDLADVVYLYRYFYLSGPAPCR
jgi:hypothetical protein